MIDKIYTQFELLQDDEERRELVDQLNRVTAHLIAIDPRTLALAQQYCQLQTALSELDGMDIEF